MKEREMNILNNSAMQIVANVAEQVRAQQVPLIQSLQPLWDTMLSDHNLLEQKGLDIVAATAPLSSETQTLVPDNVMNSMSKFSNIAATKPYQDMDLFNPNSLVAFQKVAITPELREFRTQLEASLQVMGSSVRAITCQTPAKKYKLYKSSINKSLHFASITCQTPGTKYNLYLQLLERDMLSTI